MRLEIIAAYQNLGEYCAQVENGGNAEALWEQYAIEPYWKTLCQYTTDDLSYRKPQPITDIPSLKKQNDLLNQIDLIQLKAEFEKIAAALPNYDDDPITIALYPLGDNITYIKELQNGVIGTSTFGNIIININPFAEDYREWIPYVFAHEYHHTVFGNYWFVIHGGEAERLFIDSLLIDGEADSFALSFYPQLRPRWLFDMSEETEKRLWEEQYSKIILEPEQNVDYGKFMFGDTPGGIPWCAGYAMGYRIVQQFLRDYPDTTFRQLLEMRPLDIYRMSGYESVIK